MLLRLVELHDSGSNELPQGDAENDRSGELKAVRREACSCENVEVAVRSLHVI